MPQCKTATGLQKLCIKSIVKNLSYWTKAYEDHFLDKGKFRHILGPFDEIPTPLLVHDLANELIKQRKLTRPSLHLLLHGGLLQHLDFSTCPRLVTDEVVFMIADKCKKVKSLNLTGCLRVSTQAFEILANNLPYAVRLNFSKTRIGAIALQSLFRSCRDLEELVLQHCQVCDDDVGVLCNMAMQQQRFRLCKLDLSSSMVTDMGVRALLRSIPHLKDFQYSNLINCIIAESPITEEYEQQYLLGSVADEDTAPGFIRGDVDKGRNSLTVLGCTDFHRVSDQQVKLISLLCPCLVSLDLQCAQGFSDKGLASLVLLDQLQELKLTGTDQLTFQSGVVKFLERRGEQLKVLSLEEFDCLDLILLGQLCPNLCKLLVFMMSDSVTFTLRDHYVHVHHEPFSYLEECALWCTTSNRTLTSTMLGRVLSHCRALRSLDIIRAANLIDSVLGDAVLAHGFPQLRFMSLNECNAVTCSSISQLIGDERNPLQALNLMGCFHITRRDYEGWCKLVKRRNYNIQIAWK